MVKELYVIADKSRLVVKNFLKELEPMGINIHIVPPAVGDIACLPKEHIHVIFFLGEDINSIILQTILMAKKELDMDLYLIGTPNNLSIEEANLYNSIPSTRFTSFNPDLEKMLSVIEDNDLEKKRVLVVDDEPIILRSVKGWLEDSFEVFLVNSGEMAIEFLDKHPVDLILLDYKMPTMDGPEVLRRIRADERLKKLAVIFLTANNDREMIKTALSYKPEGYILKTMEPADIKKSVKEFFKNRIQTFS